jgi:hypothetical protein
MPKLQRRQVSQGDFIVRTSYLDDDHVCGVIVDFDSDNDPIILWNGGVIEEEFMNMVMLAP